MTNDIALVYPSIIGSSGTKSYVENTMSGLKKIGIHFQSIPISKREVSIMGKPYFGIILQYLSSLTKSSVESVVHSLSPDVVIKGTNIVTVHDIIPFTNPELYMKSAYDRLAYKFSFSRALKVNTILTSTEFGKKVLTQNTMIREERIRVVHHSIDHSKFFPASEDPFRDHKKINLVMVSDFNPRKRIDKVIEAIGGDDEIDFYHIGPSQGWSDNYNALLHKSKNFRNIRFMGQMNSSELRKYLTFADLFVFLSDNEGFGLPPLEAMACGLNVLVNDLPVFRETLGSLAKFSDLSAFCKDDIMDALKAKKPKDELIEFSNRYSVENHAKKLNEIYSDVKN